MESEERRHVLTRKNDSCNWSCDRGLQETSLILQEQKLLLWAQVRKCMMWLQSCINICTAVKLGQDVHSVLLDPFIKKGNAKPKPARGGSGAIPFALKQDYLTWIQSRAIAAVQELLNKLSILALSITCINPEFNKEKRRRKKKKFTYSLTAGVFGGDVEVDHVLTHNDVWNPITIVSNLSRPQRPSVVNQPSVHVWPVKVKALMQIKIIVIIMLCQLKIKLKIRLKIPPTPPQKKTTLLATDIGQHPGIFLPFVIHFVASKKGKTSRLPFLVWKLGKKRENIFIGFSITCLLNMSREN